MNGLINRAIERFVRDKYGRDVWMQLMRELDLGFTEFEPMLVYDRDVTARVLGTLATTLKKPLADILEDLGTYLVAHPSMEAVRRLMRFGGESFAEFLLSLDEVPGRVRLAVSDLHLPSLHLYETGPQTYCLHIASGAVDMAGFGHVLVGLLRAMADDYGALVLLDYTGEENGVEKLGISLMEATFSSGRAFELGGIM